MKYRSLLVILVSIGILFSLSSCMQRKPLRIYDASNISPAETARISVPVDIKVVSIDGQRVKSLADYVLSTIEEIHVAPGEHDLVVYYSDFWNYHKRKHKEIKSKDIALKFYAERGGIYTLTHPELDDIMEAETFAENPDIRITKTGRFSSNENKGTRSSRSVEMSDSKRYTEPERSSFMERDTAIKGEWNSPSAEEKEEFRKWLAWKDMSEEEKVEFKKWLEWKNISEEENREFRKWLEWLEWK